MSRGNTTAGRCKPCGRAFTWASHCARLHEMACPGCGKPLTQTTSRLRVRFEAIDNDTARAQALKVRAEREAKRQALLATPGYVEARALKVGDVVAHFGKLCRIDEIEPCDRGSILIRATYVYTEPDRNTGGATIIAAKTASLFADPATPMLTYTDADVERYIDARKARTAATASA